MNICLLCGRIVKNAVLKGTEPKTLSFTLETRYGYNESEKKDRMAFVPCVLFNPLPELAQMLSTQGEGLCVELEGRISGPSPEANGGRKFGTEVIVRNKSLVILDVAPVAA
jgi:single-stranded DNA-binding protein